MLKSCVTILSNISPTMVKLTCVCSCDSDEKIEHGHLLVLVHGILVRHAVAVLYSAAVSQASVGAGLSNSGNSHLPRGSLAGLEPMNFITLATPHLGVGGRKQVLYISCYNNWNSSIV
ncbi:hypothetical protein HID58_061057 [Brassica napus]|uniref:BnaC04g26540D protein n=2 Tax=Brassica napus TaxID=3708 RepID=A0A078FJ30_BRANA|nr:hypothetical protein HID58_061057 [Brassica napus]CAF1853250.1 unnamed protein product [Brassica napus]CDY13181.1 BnaC04g26540D [Brassica napus]